MYINIHIHILNLLTKCLIILVVFFYTFYLKLINSFSIITIIFNTKYSMFKLFKNITNREAIAYRSNF